MYSYNYDNLKRVANSPKGKEFLKKVERDYLSLYSGKIIPASSYSLIKLYYKEGDRAQYEQEYFEKRKRLTFLQLLAIKDDCYIDELEEVMSAICDEFTWVLPAHNYNNNTQTFDRTFIDLFSAETAFYLSETLFVLGDKLSNDIKYRVKLSVEDKIIKNYESRTFWWERCHSNWASVCGLGVGLSYLYLFPERYEAIKDRLETCFENYLSGIDEEGYCYEGLAYWGYGFTFFMLFYDVYVTFNSRPEILDREKVYKLISYPLVAQMDKGVYIPFADGGCRYYDMNRHLPCFYVIKKLYGDKFNYPIKVDEKCLTTNVKALGFRFLLALECENEVEYVEENKNVYYKHAEVLLYKNKNYSFVAKSGNNKELHNHNDIGVFQIVKDSKRLIVDIGAARYTKNYFIQSEKYKEDIFVCGSMSHSVPIIDNKYQEYGEEYVGKVLEVTKNTFEVDITNAYAKGDHFVKVRYELKDKGVHVKYTFSGIKDNIVFRFVSEYEPTLRNNEVVVENMTITSKNGIIPKFGKGEYLSHLRSNILEEERGKAFLIDYTVKANSGEEEFYFEI